MSKKPEVMAFYLMRRTCPSPKKEGVTDFDLSQVSLKRLLSHIP